MPATAAGNRVTRILAGLAATSTGSSDRSFTKRVTCPPGGCRRFAYQFPRRVVGATSPTAGVEPRRASSFFVQRRVNTEEASVRQSR